MLLLLTSLENYYEVEWFICCDNNSAKIIQSFDNINIVKITDLNFSPSEFLGDKGKNHKLFDLFKQSNNKNYKKNINIYDGNTNI